MIRIIKKFLVGVVILILLIIITWRIDRTFFHPYIPNFDDEIRSDVTTLKFTVPKDKESCEEIGGVWKKIGIRPMEECNIPTKDSGKICSGSNQCEGVCLANLSYEDTRKGMKGRIFKTQGQCSNFIKVVGCRGYVYFGWAKVICAD